MTKPSDKSQPGKPVASATSEPGRADLHAETVIAGGDETQVEFADVLQKSQSVESDPVQREENCLELVERLRDIHEIRRLTKRAAKDGSPDPAPTFLGQFELLESLGSGGMGQVFKARHAQLGKIQAVKLLHAHRLHHKETVARFQREIRTIGQLQHPNIVSAHHADEADGVPYLVMDYVEGQSLSQLVEQYRKNEKQIPVSLACELIRQTALGIQYAHEQGVIHRDIKPGNIMLDRFGVVRVLDLGLARLTSQDDSPADGPELTTDQQVLGTPNYMAPEQLRSSRNVDGRTDLYALGATLFNLLSGRVPYPTEGDSSLLEKAMQIMNDPVPNIRELRSDVPPALADLVSRCLQKEPDDRLATAGELAQQLSQWAAADVVSTASPESDLSAGVSTAATRIVNRTAANNDNIPPRTSWKWIAGAVLLPIILIAGVIFRLQSPDGGELLVECDVPDAQITITAVQGAQNKAFQLSQQPDGLLKLATGTWEIRIAGLDADSFELSTHRIVMSSGETKRLSVTRKLPEKPAGHSIAATPKVTQPKPLHPQDGISPQKPGAASSVAGQLSDDVVRQRMAAVDWQPGQATTLPGYASFPTTLPGMPSDWQILPKFAHDRNNMVASPHGTYFASWDSSGDDPYIRIVERITGRLVGMFTEPRKDYQYLSWSADESQILFSSARGSEQTYRFAVYQRDGILLSEWSSEGPTDAMHEWSPDGARILIVGRNGTEQRTSDGQRVETFIAPERHSTITESWNVLWSPDGSRFAVPSDGEICIYAKDGGEPITVLQNKEGVKLTTCAWHPSGEKILTNGGQNYDVPRLWNLSGDFVEFPLPRFAEAIQSFSPDGRFFVTNYGAVKDLTDRLVSNLSVSEFEPFHSRTDVRWPKASRLILFSPLAHSGFSIEYSPTGKQLAEYNFPRPLQQTSTSWTGDENRFLSVARGHVDAWQFTWGLNPDKDESKRLKVPISAFAAFSPDGKGYASSDGQFKTSITMPGQEFGEIYDTSGTHRDKYKTAKPHVLNSWSPDSSLLATAPRWDYKGPVEIWRGAEKIASLGLSTVPVMGLAWSPNSSYLAIWDSESNTAVWDLNSPAKPITTRKGFGALLAGYSLNQHQLCPRWSPDGHWLAIPTETSILLVSPTGEKDVAIACDKDATSVIWWRPDGQALVVGKTIYEVSGNKIGQLQDQSTLRSLPFLSWIDDERLVTTARQRVCIFDDVAQQPAILSLPGYRATTTPPVSLLSRGMNAKRVSADGRYLLSAFDIDLTSQFRTSGGDIYLVDLQQKRHLWTGLTFSDGTQVRVEPTGRIQSLPKHFDQYLTYVVRYATGRVLPLTRAQFASRINLSGGAQFLQQTIDFGAGITLAGDDSPLSASDLLAVGMLPGIEEVRAIDLSGIRYINDDGMLHVGELAALEHLQLQNTSITTHGLADLSKLTRLRTLNLSGLKLTDSISEYLPDNLEELDVSQTDIGDFFTYDLKNFKSLQRVVLTGTKVSPAAIADLKNALPNCEIIAQ